jgi:site-specific recombinase
MSFGGLIGILLHTLKTVRDINKRNASVNFKDVLGEYWKSEYISLISSLICFGAMLFIASEFVNLKQIDATDYTQSLKERFVNFKIASFIKLTSIVVGYFSDSIVYGFLGVTEKNINKKIEALGNEKND